jgi:ASC-1-like (ASCH) protein
MNLHNKLFNLIKHGRKTIEMRLNKENRKSIPIVNSIEFTNILANEKVECLVLNKYEYDDFDELYKHHNKIFLGYLENEEADPKDMFIYYKQVNVNKDETSYQQKK